MSRFYQPLPFSAAYAFVASKPVTLNGQVLVPGDPIDKAGLNPRRLRQLYEARIISPVAAPEQPQAEQPAAEAPAAAPEAAQAPEQHEVGLPPEESADDPHEPSEAELMAAEGEAPEVSASGNRIEHRGFGRYYVVDAEGNDVSGPWSKAEAPKHLEG